MRWPPAFSRLRGVRADFISFVERPADGGAEIVLAKRDFSRDERRQLAADGAAMGDGSFPIETVADLENAIGLAGRAANPSAARSHLIARAKALGAVDRIPEHWGVNKADPTTSDVHTDIPSGSAKNKAKKRKVFGKKPAAADASTDGGDTTTDDPEDAQDQGADEGDENPDGTKKSDSQASTKDEEKRKRVLIDGEDPNKPDVVEGELSPEEMARQRLTAASIQKNNTGTNANHTFLSKHSDAGESMSDDLDSKIEGLDPEVRSYVEALEDRVATIEEDVKKAAEAAQVEKGDEQPTIETILKTAAPEVVAIIKAAQDEATAAKTEAEQATALAKSERETRLRREFLTKAEAMKHLSEEPTALATLLYDLNEKDAGLATKVEEVLAKAEAGISTGELFKSLGTDARAAATTEAKIESIAKAHRDANPKLTAEEARSQAYLDDPALYTQYLEEMGA